MKASETALGPGRAHDRRAGAPTGRVTVLPTKKHAKKNNLVTLTAGVFFFDKSPNAVHILSQEAYGFESVAIEPGYKVGINDGNFSFTVILTTPETTSTPGAKVR